MQLEHFEPGELPVGGSGLRLRDGLGLGVRCGSLGHLRDLFASVGGVERLADAADQEGLVGAAGGLAGHLGELRLQLVQLHLVQVRDLLLRLAHGSLRAPVTPAS
ncbi:MAG: hypothetical protein WBP56_12130 [Polyangia bacterium]